MPFDQKCPQHLEVGVFCLRAEAGRSIQMNSITKANEFFWILSWQVYIRTTFFDQKSSKHPDVAILSLRAYEGEGGIYFLVWTNYCVNAGQF